MIGWAKRCAPSAVETAVGIYTGLAPVTIPFTAMLIAGGIEKLLTLIF